MQQKIELSLMVLSCWRSPAQVSSYLLDFDDSSSSLQAAAPWLSAMSGHVHRLLTNYNTLVAGERKKKDRQEQANKLASFTPLFVLLSNWHRINAASTSRHIKLTARCLRSGHASLTCHLTQALTFPSVSAVWTQSNNHQGWMTEAPFSRAWPGE